jgi:hypothetical protein
MLNSVANMVAKFWGSRIVRKVTRLYWAAQRWRARRRHRWLYVIFFVLFVAAFIALLTSPFYPSLHMLVGDRVVLFVGLLTGAIIWWQGHLIRRQMELDTALNLYTEWNSKDMRQNRSATWLDDKPDPERIEDVLEFLEKVSTFEKERFISLGLIWDTFGWYLWRYYFYCKDVIIEKRNDWTPGHTDTTLYQDLEELYPKLLRVELAERNCGESDGKKLTESDVIRELEETTIKFIECEKSEADD